MKSLQLFDDGMGILRVNMAEHSLWIFNGESYNSKNVQELSSGMVDFSNLL